MILNTKISANTPYFKGVTYYPQGSPRAATQYEKIRDVGRTVVKIMICGKPDLSDGDHCVFTSREARQLINALKPKNFKDNSTFKSKVKAILGRFGYDVDLEPKRLKIHHSELANNQCLLIDIP